MKNSLKYFAVLLLVLAGAYWLWAGGSGWCKAGDSFNMKDLAVSVIGPFRSPQTGGDYCYARSASGSVVTYYWVDKAALAAMRSGSSGEAGRGCLVMKVSGTKTGTELCW